MPYKNKADKAANGKKYWLKIKGPEYYDKHREKKKAWVKSENGKAYSKKKYARTKDIMKARCKKNREQLKPGYVSQHLRKLGFSTAEIQEHPELIKTKRVIIKTNRL